VNDFARIFPYFWFYRRQVILSAILATFVAVLWGLNLSATFPLVKVLLEGKTLHEFVDDRMGELNEQIVDAEQSILTLDPSDHTQLARRQDRLSEANRTLAAYTTLRQWVLPLVPQDRFATFVLLLVVLLLVTTVKGALSWLQEVLIGSTAQRCVMRIRKDCLRHVLRLDSETIRSTGSSDILSRFTNDCEYLVPGLTQLGVRLVREPLKAVACILFAFLFNWRLTLLSLLAAPLMVFAFQRFGKSLKKASKETLESVARMYKSLGETLDSFRIVTAYNAARRHRHQFHKENQRYYKHYMRVVRIGALASPSTELLGMAAVFLALLPGVYMVLRTEDTVWGLQLSAEPMDVSDLLVLYALLAGTLDPIRKLTGVFRTIKSSAAASERVFGIMDMQTRVSECPTPRRLPAILKTIRFDEVGFTYASSGEKIERPAALKDISLTVNRGEVVAVVGTNGSGKSTLLNLLPRFCDCTKGAVRFDTIDIRDVRLSELRDRIGLVSQETQLFDMSIAENIRYGRPSATREEIEQAAKSAHVMQFIDSFPDGLDTPVGEQGYALSGGQRQRVSLARAILKNPEILILDEATSAIDQHSERLIHETLSAFCTDRTVFIISHVLNQTFLDLISRVVVLDDGKIVGDGTHEQLLKNCPQYQNLCQYDRLAA
jgi:ATP-binding cassette, subfamily B, bacterial MsbA